MEVTKWVEIVTLSRDIIKEVMCKAPVDKDLIPIIDDYLRDRKVSFFYDNNKHSYKVGKGCP